MESDDAGRDRVEVRLRAMERKPAEDILNRYRRGGVDSDGFEDRLPELVALGGERLLRSPHLPQ